METTNKIERRPLGSQGLIVSAQGLGVMSMTAFYVSDKPNDEESFKTIETALNEGINFFDTAWVYQNFQTGETNEGLLGRAVKKFGRDKFVIATKFGICFDKEGKPQLSGKPEFVRQQCNESLQRLGVDYIDLYYQHRPDPDTPIEETMGELKKLIEEGKIKYVGLSECTPDELERAHKVVPITAIQMEWSLQTRDLEKDIIPCARKLGVGIVSYSPLGRGLLTTKFENDTLLDGDFRKDAPRFSDENLQKNKEAAKKLEEWGKPKGLTAGQVALAWVHARGNDVFPIPGTTKSHRLRENAAAARVKLTDKDCEEIEKIMPTVYGERYNENLMKSTFNSRL